MEERLQRFYCKVEKYSEGVHYLNKGIDYDSIKLYEEKYCINIPNTLKEFLQKSNGGELFALPAGINIARVFLAEKREERVFFI